VFFFVTSADFSGVVFFSFYWLVKLGLCIRGIRMFMCCLVYFILVFVLFVPLLFLLYLLRGKGRIGFFSLGAINEVLTGWAKSYILGENLVDLSCFAL
jgi:hypothetical protein